MNDIISTNHQRRFSLAVENSSPITSNNPINSSIDNDFLNNTAQTSTHDLNKPLKAFLIDLNHPHHDNSVPNLSHRSQSSSSSSSSSSQSSLMNKSSSLNVKSSNNDSCPSNNDPLLKFSKNYLNPILHKSNSTPSTHNLMKSYSTPSSPIFNKNKSNYVNSMNFHHNENDSSFHNILKSHPHHTNQHNHNYSYNNDHHRRYSICDLNNLHHELNHHSNSNSNSKNLIAQAGIIPNLNKSFSDGNIPSLNNETKSHENENENEIANQNKHSNNSQLTTDCHKNHTRNHHRKNSVALKFQNPKYIDNSLIH